MLLITTFLCTVVLVVGEANDGGLQAEGPPVACSSPGTARQYTV